MADRRFISLIISRRVRRIGLCCRGSRMRLRGRRAGQVDRTWYRCRESGRQYEGANRQREGYHGPCAVAACSSRPELRLEYQMYYMGYGD
jgi:hypothetical protein